MLFSSWLLIRSGRENEQDIEMVPADSGDSSKASEKSRTMVPIHVHQPSEIAKIQSFMPIILASALYPCHKAVYQPQPFIPALRNPQPAA